MFHICFFTALDQISVDGWPELSDFGSELLSQARLVAVAPYYRAEPHIVLHTEDRRTYLRGIDFVFDLGWWISFTKCRCVFILLKKNSARRGLKPYRAASILGNINI